MISTRLLILDMNADDQPGKLTSRDRRAARIWQWLPWLSAAIVAFGPPSVFALISLLASSNAAVYLIVAASLVPFSLITAVIALIILLLFRRRWTRQLRERLASDGITADEVAWFLPELTSGERRQPLLADAYRETLALRLNATRLVASARRDLLGVERRLNRSRYLNAPDTAVLIQELNSDRARLEALKQEGSSRRAEAEARLQMIEAAASRGASWAETNFMLQRLDEGRKHAPLALEVARAEQQTREETTRELRNELTR